MPKTAKTVRLSARENLRALEQIRPRLSDLIDWLRELSPRMRYASVRALRELLSDEESSARAAALASDSAEESA